MREVSCGQSQRAVYQHLGPAFHDSEAQFEIWRAFTRLEQLLKSTDLSPGRQTQWLWQVATGKGILRLLRRGNNIATSHHMANRGMLYNHTTITCRRRGVPGQYEREDT